MKPQADIPAIIDEIELMGMRNWLVQALARAFRDARKDKLRTFNEHSYDECWMDNITRLTDAIIERYYRPSPSLSFIIFDPMIREIFAAPFVDRIVHHFLYELQAGWWDHRFIEDSYSCRDNKGTLYGAQRAHQMMCQVTQNFTRPAHVIKLDIRGYFMSLPREKLYRRVKWGLDCQFSPYLEKSAAFELYQICRFLWRQTLLDDPVSHSRRRGPTQHWRVLPHEKSLYCQPYGQGIVIGNLTSQLVSNIYLDSLDRFVKYTLGYKYYGRYVDDFFILVPDEDYEKAKHDVTRIEEYLKDELLLTLHPKKRYYGSVYQGMSFLGYRIYPHCFYPSNRVQQKLKTQLHNYKYKNAEPDKLISYFGLTKHMNADNFVKTLFDANEMDFGLYQEFKSENRRPMREILADLKKAPSANQPRTSHRHADGARLRGSSESRERKHDNVA